LDAGTAVQRIRHAPWTTSVIERLLPRRPGIKYHSRDAGIEITLIKPHVFVDSEYEFTVYRNGQLQRSSKTHDIQIQHRWVIFINFICAFGRKN